MRPRGEGGGAAREGAALLQGLLRCGRCGRRMQVAYSGRDGRVPRYACVRGLQLHGTGQSCQTLGGLRLDKAVAAAFLEAVTPAGVAASAEAVAELERQHEERLAGQRLAARAGRVRGRPRAAPVRRLRARAPARRAHARGNARTGARHRRARARQARRARTRPPRAADSDERRALARLARDLPHLWRAATTTDRDRKELLRTLIAEVIVTVREPEQRAVVEIVWEGGARSELGVRLNRRGPERRRTDEDTIELIARLAAHHPDRQIAAILNRQGRRTGTGLPFTETRVRSTRQRAGIPAAPPPDPAGDVVTIAQAAAELGVSTATVRRWLRDGLLPGEQITPGAPWRIRLTDEVRARFVPDIPDGFVALDEAAQRLGVARQTVLHQVQRGERHAIHVTQGRRKGLRIDVSDAEAGLFDHQ